MKRFRLFGLIILFTGSISFATLQKAEAQYSINFQVFYDQLSPYGYWMTHPMYGYVWMPQAGPNFRPYYTEGYWIYTQSGWFWNSNYNWGWATFHYGSWTFDNYYGWLWIPGYDWAPAWVAWGSYGGNYGWAPLMPNYGYSRSYPPVNYWCFVPPRSFGQPHWYTHHHYVGSGNTISMGNNVVVNNVTNITIINNTTYYGQRSAPAGPPKMEIERASGNRIAAVSIRESTKPGSLTLNSNEINVYRPTVSKTNAAAKPSKLVDLQNDKDKLQNTMSLPGQDLRTNPGQRQPGGNVNQGLNKPSGYQSAEKSGQGKFQPSTPARGQVQELNKNQGRTMPMREGPSGQKIGGSGPSQSRPSSPSETGRSERKLKR